MNEYHLFKFNDFFYLIKLSKIKPYLSEILWLLWLSWNAFHPTGVKYISSILECFLLIPDKIKQDRSCKVQFTDPMNNQKLRVFVAESKKGKAVPKQKIPSSVFSLSMDAIVLKYSLKITEVSMYTGRRVN